MQPIRTVAIFGASGNFGAPITEALLSAGFAVTAISRDTSESTFPTRVRVLKIPYNPTSFREALTGHDAAICVIGPPGVPFKTAIVEAAAEAGIRRFIIDDFSWGPDPKCFPEFEHIHQMRKESWDRAAELSREKKDFTWTGITCGNPIDWALGKVPHMGFNISTRSATIYDSGTERFTGTTLAGLAQSAVGVLSNLEDTENRFVNILSCIPNQNELLAAFERATGDKWCVQRETTKTLLGRGRETFGEGKDGWWLDLAVAQLYDEGKARCMVAESWDISDSRLLGLQEETVDEVVAKVLALA